MALQTAALVPLFRCVVLVQSSEKRAKMGRETDQQFIRENAGPGRADRNREGARGGWENNQTSIIPMFGTGGIGGVLDCSAMLRKFQ